MGTGLCCVTYETLPDVRRNDGKSNVLPDWRRPQRFIGPSTSKFCAGILAERSRTGRRGCASPDTREKGMGKSQRAPGVWHRGPTGGKKELLDTERDGHPVADRPKRKKDKPNQQKKTEPQMEGCMGCQRLETRQGARGTRVARKPLGKAGVG